MTLKHLNLTEKGLKMRIYKINFLLT